jgi:hypothetical protein
MTAIGQKGRVYSSHPARARHTIAGHDEASPTIQLGLPIPTTNSSAKRVTMLRNMRAISRFTGLGFSAKRLLPFQYRRT